MSRCRQIVPVATPAFSLGPGACTAPVAPRTTAAVLLLLSLGFGAPAPALTVIHDSGETIPIAPYLAPLQGAVGAGGAADAGGTGEAGRTGRIAGEAGRDVPAPGALSGGGGAAFGSGPAPGGPLPFDVRRLLPIRSPGLKPGSLAGRTLPPAVAGRLPLLTFPIFVVGSDRLSLNWLARNRTRLQALGARGLLVQAETKEDLLAVARAGFGLEIAPVPGGELARELGLSRYPVLISPEGLMQ